MGMNFTAFMGHSMKIDELESLIIDLNDNPDRYPFINEFVNDLLPNNPNDSKKKWRLFADELDGTVDCIGPCGISLTFSERICYFHHYYRWIIFLKDNDVQHSLRKFCFDLLRTLHSPFAIYVPDNAAKESSILDLLWEDRDIFYMKEWLIENCRLPKKTILDIYQDLGDTWESDGYYLDEFTDFR